jgi:hypothetical protein
MGAVTLLHTAGYEYSIDRGLSWQSSSVFSGLDVETWYTFHQRIAATADTEASEKSAALEALAAVTLTGSVTINNMVPRVGQQLTATYVAGNNTGVLTYVWRVDGVIVHTGATYTVAAGDYGKRITAEVTSSVEWGVILSAQTSAVAKTPAGVPVAVEVAADGRARESITLVPRLGYEYRILVAGVWSQWQDSNEFTGLTKNTEYTFEQRIKATDTHYASDPSAPLSEHTLRDAGAEVTDPDPTPVEQREPEEKSSTSVTVTVIAPPASGQKVEYGVSLTDNPNDVFRWQEDPAFTDLDPDTTYYFFARSQADEQFEAGSSIPILVTTTDKSGGAGMIFGAVFGGAAVLIIAGIILLVVLKKKRGESNSKILEAAAATDKDNKFVMYKKIK